MELSTSSTLPIEYRVPQGSLLGPRLYTIYVNDLPDFVTTSDVFMYADDTIIYCTGPDVEHVISNLNSVMEQTSLWSMNNKLIIHPAKTEAMILKKTPFVGPLLPITGIITSEGGRLPLQYRGPHIWNFLNSKVKLSRNSIDPFKDILRKFSFHIHNFSFNKEAIMMKP